MGPLGVVELEGACDRVEHAGRHPGQAAAFELGVVLHAHPGQRGDLTAPEAGHPALTGDGEASLSGADLRPTGGEELAHFDSVVHAINRTARHRRLGCTVSTPIVSDFLGCPGTASLETGLFLRPSPPCCVAR